mgnify:CR=1 FL=1
MAKKLFITGTGTDIGKTYQILLQKEGHQVLNDNFRPYTTRTIKQP